MGYKQKELKTIKGSHYPTLRHSFEVINNDDYDWQSLLKCISQWNVKVETSLLMMILLITDKINVSHLISLNYYDMLLDMKYPDEPTFSI